MTWLEFVDRCATLKSAPLADIVELMHEFCDDPDTSTEDCELMLAALETVQRRHSPKTRVQRDLSNQRVPMRPTQRGNR